MAFAQTEVGALPVKHPTRGHKLIIDRVQLDLNFSDTGCSPIQSNYCLPDGTSPLSIK